MAPLMVRWTHFAILLVGSLLVAGCGIHEDSRLEITSVGTTPRTMRTDLGVGTYSQELASTSFVLTDLSVDDLQSGGSRTGHVLHIELLWIPKAGKTAVDPQATNTSIRLVIFSGKEVGIYGGGGFAWPQGELGEREFVIDIVGSTLSLVDSTPDFHDLLSPAELTGRLTASHDPDVTRRMRRATSQVVSNALKRVQWVGPAFVDPTIVAALTAQSGDHLDHHLDHALDHALPHEPRSAQQP